MINEESALHFNVDHRYGTTDLQDKSSSLVEERRKNSYNFFRATKQQLVLNMSKANTELFETLEGDAFQAHFCKTVKKMMHFFHISVFGLCHENQVNNIETVKRRHLRTIQ